MSTGLPALQGPVLDEQLGAPANGYETINCKLSEFFAAI